MVWNIEQGHYPVAIAEQLRSLDADLYLLYELDRGVRRTGSVDMYEVLQNVLGLNGCFVTEFVERDNWVRRWNPRESGGGGVVGNAVFSRFPISNYQALTLPAETYLTRSRRTFGPDWCQPRAGFRRAQVFEISPFGMPISVVSAHLEIWRVGRRHRRQQLQLALDEASSVSRIVGGDFNNVGGSLRSTAIGNYHHSETAAMRSFLAEYGLQDPFDNNETTCGWLGIRAKLDWVAASNDFAVQANFLIQNELSDHACLVVDYAPSQQPVQNGEQANGSLSNLDRTYGV